MGALPLVRHIHGGFIPFTDSNQAHQLIRSSLVHLPHLAIQLDDLIEQDPPLVIPDPAREVERVHFYLVYRGGNHRVIQEKMARYIRLGPLSVLQVKWVLAFVRYC